MGTVTKLPHHEKVRKCYNLARETRRIADNLFKLSDDHADDPRYQLRCMNEAIKLAKVVVIHLRGASKAVAATALNAIEAQQQRLVEAQRRIGMAKEGQMPIRSEGAGRAARAARIVAEAADEEGDPEDVS